MDLPAPLWPTSPIRSPSFRDNVTSPQSFDDNDVGIVSSDCATCTTEERLFSERDFASKIGKSTHAPRVSMLTFLGHSAPCIRWSAWLGGLPGSASPGLNPLSSRSRARAPSLPGRNTVKTSAGDAALLVTDTGRFLGSVGPDVQANAEPRCSCREAVRPAAFVRAGRALPSAARTVRFEFRETGPSSQPTSWACAIRSSASEGMESSVNGRLSRSSSSRSSGARPCSSSRMDEVWMSLRALAAGVVERRGAHFFQELFDHRADSHDLRRLLDHLGDGTRLRIPRLRWCRRWRPLPRAAGIATGRPSGPITSTCSLSGFVMLPSCRVWATNAA